MAEKRRGLGRGIGALIPQAQEENKNRPIDVFFGAGSAPKGPQDPADGTTVAEAEARSAPAKAKKPAEKAASTAKAPTGETTAPAKGRGSAKTTPASSSVAEAATAATSKSSATKAAVKSPATKAPAAPAKAEKPAATPAPAVPEAPAPEAPAQEAPSATIDDGLVPVPGATFGELPLEQIVPNTKQPRQIFDEEDLNELAASIAEVGVLQPVVVRPLDAQLPDAPEARYELIMGERRWRASALAGNTTVPAIVRHTEDGDLLRDALLENLHRAQLNALEEAAAYQQLLNDFGCTQEELARRIARSRPQITNTLRLLKLPPLVQRRVAAGILSAGHARALLGLSDPAAMERLAQRIVAEGLSVRAVEEIVALGDEPMAPERRRRPRAGAHDAELAELSSRLADRFDTRVKVSMGQRKGKIAVDFATIEDLNRILAVFGEKAVDLPENPTA